MTSTKNSATASPPNCGRKIVLKVRGLGHVPAKKNSMYAVVAGECRRWQKRCQAVLVSQLLSACPTSETATSTTEHLRSLIASLPADDNWKCIPEIHLTVIEVEPGEEGANIIIEEIL